MINVLVVDDDKLVRKGLISSMPWDEFDMKVVGEANNGEKALELLETHRIHLLLTDLAMPVMNGLELMRVVRNRFPDIHIAVLTLHQDFDYIQEALRLGAIDFIVKVQLEEERFEEVLGRIHNRILQEQMKKTVVSSSAAGMDPFATDTGFALLPVGEPDDVEWLYQLIGISDWVLNGIDHYIWLWLPGDEPDNGKSFEIIINQALDRSGWLVMRLEGLAGKSKKEVLSLLRNYRMGDLFYDFDDSRNDLLHKSIHELPSKPKSLEEEEFTSLKARWLSFDWTQQESLEGLKSELIRLRLPSSRLNHFLHEIAMDWNRVYGELLESNIELPAVFKSWGEAASWLALVRETACLLQGTEYSWEVVNSIMTAVKIVKDELDQQLYAIDVAKRVNMSRSYFNQCFKDIVSQSFNEYLRQVRMKRAEEYLLQSRKPVQWIAERTGYVDVKYFSRIFRESTGMTPSEYRKNKSKAMNV
ncbi:helix-turn-helix domain-containing protein [Paenibacillus sepulcri]|uniref:Response regulator n=1 Tax=Paenibacillus sepulcri TaxID=359917 RepID=A0ABS7C323_9BACL|nr:response regulator [Paenibacillus sepulcri]